MLLLCVKMAVFLWKCYKFDISTLKVLSSKYSIEKKAILHRCGINKKELPFKGDYNWFRLAILPCDQSPKDSLRN